MKNLTEILAWKVLTDYVGGMDGNRTQSDYEKAFGEVGPQTPFGKHIWDGLMELTPIYREIRRKELMEMDDYFTWVWAFAMPNHFSIKMAASPIDASKESQPSDSLHPAVFILKKMKHDVALAAKTDINNRVWTARVFRSISHLSLMQEQGTDISVSIINSHV